MVKLLQRGNIQPPTRMRGGKATARGGAGGGLDGEKTWDEGRTPCFKSLHQAASFQSRPMPCLKNYLIFLVLKVSGMLW